MPTDTAVLERALTVMAICMAIQTLVCVSAVVGALIAWRKAQAAATNAKAQLDLHVAELRGHLDHIAGTVDEAAHALMRGSSAVDGVVSDMRDAVGTMRSSVGTVASVVTAPRAALAIGLLQGLNVWRKRRATRPTGPARTPERAPSQSTERGTKGDSNEQVGRS